MEFSITKRQWNISKKDLNAFSYPKLEEVLSSFNRACSGHFYMVDYYQKKIIVDSQNALILCGHPKALADEKGFAFFGKILKQEEAGWIMRMNVAAYKVLFNQPINQRTKSIVSYDLTFIMEGKEVVLHHKVTPYKLCKNGNVWLGLCYVSASSLRATKGDSVIFNSETGERYSFINNEFVLLDKAIITPEDIRMLRFLVTGLSDKEIGLALGGFNNSTFKYKKRRLFEKLDVTNSAGAVHKAHLLGII